MRNTNSYFAQPLSAVCPVYEDHPELIVCPCIQRGYSIQLCDQVYYLTGYHAKRGRPILHLVVKALLVNQ